MGNFNFSEAFADIFGQSTQINQVTSKAKEETTFNQSKPPQSEVNLKPMTVSINDSNTQIQYNHRCVSLAIGKEKFVTNVQEYIRRQYNAKCTYEQASEIFRLVGSAIENETEGPEPAELNCPNIITDSPLRIYITHEELYFTTNKLIKSIEQSIISFFEELDEISKSHILIDGIVLSGNGAEIRGIIQRFKKNTGIYFIPSATLRSCFEMNQKF